MPVFPPTARHVLRHLLSFYWEYLGDTALQTTSNNDRIPYYRTPSAAEPTLQPTHPEPDDLRQETDAPPDPPDDKPTAEYTLTKDRIFLGPPLGGALCFTFQAITLTAGSPGLSRSLLPLCGPRDRHSRWHSR